jgi:hypothetical protein
MEKLTILGSKFLQARNDKSKKQNEEKHIHENHIIKTGNKQLGQQKPKPIHRKILLKP